MHAIVQAGIRVRSVVARGVSEDAFDVMDTGRSGNAADVLHIHRYPSQNALSAAARGLMFVERYGRVFPSQRDSHLYVTPVTTLQYVKEHPELIDGVRLGDRIYHSGIQGGIGLWAIVMTMFLRLDRDQAEQFTEHLTTGAGLHRGDPLLMLRNRLLGSQRDQYSTLSGRVALVAIAIKAVECVARSRRMQHRCIHTGFVHLAQQAVFREYGDLPMSWHGRWPVAPDVDLSVNNAHCAS